MIVFVDSFLVPKAGNQPSECEDAFFPPPTEEQRGQQLRFTVSDGASSGMLSGEWARVLTEVACQFAGPLDDIHAVLRDALESWDGWLHNYLRMRDEQNRPIKWYEEPGLRAGAFATLLGLELNERQNTNEWLAFAIGDSCLFQVRQGQLMISFPLQHSAAFNNNPFLLCSLSTRNENLDDAIAKTSGDWQIDDEFYLMTDALAQWFLTEYEAGQQPWNVLRDLNTVEASQAFEEFVDSLRESQSMRNDDVALVRITLA